MMFVSRLGAMKCKAGTVCHSCGGKGESFTLSLHLRWRFARCVTHVLVNEGEKKGNP